MARKHHKKHKKHIRRRRMSGPITPQKKDLLLLLAGAVTGSVAKRFGDTALAKQTAVTIDPKLLAAGEFIVGGGLAWFSKAPFLQGFGIGIASEAAVSGLQAMKVLTGIGGPQDQVINFSKMLGRPNPNFGGATRTPSVSGATVYNFPKPAAVGGARRRDGM